MMRKRMGVTAGLGLTVLTAMGCQSKLYDENQALRNQNIELQDQLGRKDAELAGRPQAQDVASLQGALADRDRQIADLQSQLAKPAPGNTPAPESGGLSGITVSRDDKAGTITVNVPGDILFASGDAAIKKNAEATLDKIAGLIKKDFGGKKLIVDGFTDTDPITRTKDKWKDNLDLSAARARSVHDYLTTKGGFAKSQVGMRAFGDTQPKSSKDKSRRVEIVVVTRS